MWLEISAEVWLGGFWVSISMPSKSFVSLLVRNFEGIWLVDCGACSSIERRLEDENACRDVLVFDLLRVLLQYISCRFGRCLQT